ncbi:mitochondrial 5-aminolevulinate synthase [Lambiella insularis]|nr:mitochondrial 5-aminolevulinate synthase [Lambiella insularis]
MIFANSDMLDLETKLASPPRSTPKIIAFESVCSMSGSVASIKNTCRLAQNYSAITLLDEVHAIEQLDFETNQRTPPNAPGTVMAQVDIVTGTFGKAYSAIGGYIAGKADMVDTIRSLAPGFIFTTSPPPAVLAGACASVEHQIAHSVQAINHAPIASGSERLRVTATPSHGPALQAELLRAVVEVWRTVGLKSASDWAARGGKCGVGDPYCRPVARLRTDRQLDREAFRGRYDTAMGVETELERSAWAKLARPEVGRGETCFIRSKAGGRGRGAGRGLERG